MKNTSERVAPWNRGDITILRLVGGLIALLPLVCAAWFDPHQVAAGEHLSWIGVDPGTCLGCPLCGLSRGFSLAMHGEFSAAGSLNLAFWPVFAAMIACASQFPLALRSLYLKP